MIDSIINNSENFNYLLFHLPLALFTLGYLIVCRLTITGQLSSKRFWWISLIYIFLMRLQDFQMPFSMNPDEEQWLICANSIVDDPSLYFTTFFICDFTRFFSIIPLTFFRLFTDYVTYEHARFLNICLFYYFIFLQFKLLSLWFNKSVVVPIITLFIVLFSSASHFDFVDYNSEMPSIVFFTLALYLFARNIFTQNKSTFSYFHIGLILAITPFIKEQGVFISLLISVLFSLKLIINKNWKALIYLYLGSLTFIIIYLGSVFLFYGFSDIIKIIETGLEYKSMGLNAAHSWEYYFIRAIKIEFLNKIWLIPVSLFLISFVNSWRNFNLSNDKSKSQALIFFSFLSLILLYTVNMSSNPLFHYTLFFNLSMPFIITLGFEKFLIQQENHILVFLTISLVFIIQSDGQYQSLRKIYVNESQCKECFNNYNEKDIINQIIKENRKSNDAMVIWGWENKYLVYNKLKRGSAYIYPQFAFKGYKNRQIVLNRYQNNINQIKPTFIAELVGKGRHWFNDRDKYGLSQNAPDLYLFILDHYTILAEGQNYRIYKRKN